GTLEHVLPGSLGRDTAVLEQRDAQHRQSLGELGDGAATHRYRRAHDQPRVQTERGDEVARLELPIGEATGNDFEAGGKPFDGGKDLRRIFRVSAGRSLELEDDLRLDLRRLQAAHR